MSSESTDEQVEMFSDPARYRTLSEPFDNMAEASEAIDAFVADVLAARVRHGLADVHVVIRANVRTQDGDEGTATVDAHFGDTLQAEPMLAYALGREQCARQERIARLLSSALKTPRGSR